MNHKLKHTVLIVDDDVDDRESIRDAFLENRHHHDYTFLTSGEHLIQHLAGSQAQEQPSLILLDLNMPGKDGREILKELKKDKVYQPIPIVVLTTSSSEKDRDVSYELGANCFITKPNSYSELVEITDSIARLWCHG
ncbi:MAG: response regulator [Flavipsychrobacter sp.]|jgi:CheY-like chemotaxis protein|nr:response regulator [Flavipsychrobacter sp.]